MPSSSPLAAVVSPEPGIVWDGTGRPYLAPLTIVTARGDDYLLKFKNVDRTRDDLDFWAYVRGGENFEIKAPLGTFNLNYASGKTWFGYDSLFGPNTVYEAADRSFTFSATRHEYGVSYQGVTIRLVKKVDGNMHTRSLQPSDF